MRTKTLLLAAALSAAGLATSLAQSNVYSLNVVGYINIPVSAAPGFNLLANQLDLDGTGTNNTINTVLGTNLPSLSKVVGWGGSGWTLQSLLVGGSWTAAQLPGINSGGMQPGQAVFFQNPAANPVTNVTLVGNVLQGNLSRTYAAGYAPASSMVPQSGTVAALGFGSLPQFSHVLRYTDPVSGEVVGGYRNYNKIVAGDPGTWSPPEPTINVGEGFLLQTAAGYSWARSFTVQ